MEILERQEIATVRLFEGLSEERVRGCRYELGKWTLKEVLGHLADDERIFAYRALAVARGDSTELPGFDENAYVRSAEFEARSLASLIAEYRSVRQGSITLFAGLPAAAWRRRGIVNGYEATPRGLAFHIAGHELHHHRVMRERYGAVLGGAGAEQASADVRPNQGSGASGPAPLTRSNTSRTVSGRTRTR